MHCNLQGYTVTLCCIILISLIIKSQSCSEITDIESCNNNYECLWVQKSDTMLECTSHRQSICECISKFKNACNPRERLDVIILADISCPMSRDQCRKQQQEIADTMFAFRGTKTRTFFDSTVISTVRVGYIEYGSIGTDPSVIVDLLHNPINLHIRDPITSRITLYDEISDSAACDRRSIPLREGKPNLFDAIQTALNQFNYQSTSNNLGYDKKILIFSNCGVDDTQKEAICERYEDEIRLGSAGAARGANQNGKGINVIMINNMIQHDVINPDSYIMCLVEYDEQRIFSIEESDDYNSFLPAITNELCEYPSPAPTTDPSADPTAAPPNLSTSTSTTATTTDTTTKALTTNPSNSPTTDPTKSPTTDPTGSPSTDPTGSPTIDPTKAPTTDPTGSPSTDPTDSPSTDPTNNPTTPAPITPEPSYGAGGRTATPTDRVSVETDHSSSPTKPPIYSIEVFTKAPTFNNVIVTYPPTQTPTGYNAEVQNVGQVANIATAESEKDAFPWIWISIGIGSCCCIGVIGVFIFKNRANTQSYGYIANQQGHEQSITLSDSDFDAESGAELQQLAVGGDTI